MHNLFRKHSMPELYFWNDTQWDELYIELPSRILQPQFELCAVSAVLPDMPAEKLCGVLGLPDQHIFLWKLLCCELPIEHDFEVRVLYVGYLPAIKLHQMLKPKLFIVLSLLHSERQHLHTKYLAKQLHR